MKETMNLPNSLKRIKKLIGGLKQAAGFTMIELLIVISILGILAVAVLSAIDPIEQINRGRDTGLRSDTEQLISAVDRYNAFQGYFPWVSSAAAVAINIDDGAGNPVIVDLNLLDDQATSDCEILNKLSDGDTTATACPGSNELKLSFINRISAPEYRGLYIYNEGAQGDSTYVCFSPQSGAFITEAENRCNGSLPDDFPSDFACPAPVGSAIEAFICLP